MSSPVGSLYVAELDISNTSPIAEIFAKAAAAATSISSSDLEGQSDAVRVFCQVGMSATIRRLRQPAPNVTTYRLERKLQLPEVSGFKDKCRRATASQEGAEALVLTARVQGPDTPQFTYENGQKPTFGPAAAVDRPYIGNGLTWSCHTQHSMR